jgi:beta-N-acetylhexosaminidase
VRYFLNLGLILILLVALPAAQVAGGSVPVPQAQGGGVANLMAQMSAAEKVGQLFLVTFYGPTAADGTDIQKLIAQYHVGGVMLLAANDNFTDTVATSSQVFALTRQLQAANTRLYTAAGAEAATLTVPLFVGWPQTESGYQTGGFLAWPSNMTLGATWDPAQAEAIGALAGRELAALGINLLLGPSLDVSETPEAHGTWDVGTDVYGGNPFWTGVIGQAYIRGVHTGAGGQVAVVPGHFPGQGASDRNPDKEVTTLHKSLEAMRQSDLIPFFAAAGRGITESLAVADGLMTTHVRLQGFQGGRQTTLPLSFDQQTLSQLLTLPEMGKWRVNGGLTLSGSLGADAIKQFAAPFKPRLVARDAFLAGNDLLYLADFGNNPRTDQTGNVIDTLTYFTQRYIEDQTFAAKVDGAVARILALKLARYVGQAEPTGDVTLAGPDQDRVLALAQAAATLISGEVTTPPVPSDRMVFFTDARAAALCSVCPMTSRLDRRALERSVVQLYGSNGSGQVQEGRLQSFTFDDLANYLSSSVLPTPEPGVGTPTPTPPAVETALAQASWLVFSMLDVNPAVPASSVVSSFLSQRPDLLRGKRIVVFGFGAPYYLDTTDLSKINAYFALYSVGPVFTQTAARLLFNELVPRGAPPVSVASVGYDLREVTSPDPARSFEIASPSIPQTSTVQVGTTVLLRTTEILDHNGRQVPDGTQVNFSVLYQGVEFPAILGAQTAAGVAEVSLTLPANRAGQMEVTASSGQAQARFSLRFLVPENKQIVVITVIPPTATPLPSTPTVTLAPTSTPVPPTATSTSTVTPTPTPTPTPPDRLAWSDFLVLCLCLAAVMVGGYFASAVGADPQQRLRVALAGAIGVLLGYNAYAMGWPGTIWLDMLLGGVGGLAVGWFGFVRRGWGRTR